MAEYQLGDFYYFVRDCGGALRWISKSAWQGNADAQFSLGYMYSEGEGVLQDYHESAWWYRKAAEQGHSGAQFNLAQQHIFGQGVTQDHGEAALWYRKAAGEGEARAQTNLGVLYANGQGVLQDLVLAHKWWNIAGSQSDTRALQYRREVERRMTAGQIAEAQRLAREWMQAFEERTAGRWQ